MVNSKGNFYEDPFKAVDDAYADGVKIDEHVVATVLTENGEPIAKIQDGDSVIHFNFRKDRGRQLSAALYDKNFTAFERTPPSIYFVTMTEFDRTIGANIAFGQQVFSNHLGEWLSKQGLKNLRVAETEKYAHITFYLNALCDIQYEGEDRILINSPKVKANFDEKPEMSAFGIRDAVLENIRANKYDAIMINFANCDLVGHSGVFKAAVQAAEVVDQCVGEIVDATLEAGGIAVVTADHGNAELMIDPNTGIMVTSHTMSPVPFFVIGVDGLELRDGGGLADIAPTVLDLMGIDQSEEMTGESLLA
jgi:2,3-bisphosphoglycerate-independent phosphoglycerate mutase